MQTIGEGTTIHVDKVNYAILLGLQKENGCASLNEALSRVFIKLGLRNVLDTEIELGNLLNSMINK